MPDNDLPTFAETDLTALWAYRQEHEETEQYGNKRRRHAEKEIYRRAAEADATILQTDAGPVEITYSNTYAYNSAVVDGAFFALIRRDGLEKEWNQFVKHAYKINKNWLNRLEKRGGEYREIIEKMTTAGTGSPSLKGPSLQEMGDYAPREEALA